MVIVQLRDKITEVLDILEGVFHCERDEAKLVELMRHEEPLDGLVLTILSQNTNDRNRDSAFVNLKSKWSSWEEVSKVDRSDLADSIRTAGLSVTKSERIIFILNKIKADFGDYSLKGLIEKERNIQGFAKDYLNSLPGIGPKTTACVLLFDLGLPAFPVDTHIARVCNRLGIVPPGTKGKAVPEKISEFMQKETPRERFLGAHVNIIEFGRNICKAQKPKCGECPVQKFCLGKF